MTENQTTQNFENDKATPNRPSFTGCLLKVIAGLLLLAVGLYALQSMLAPDVVDDKTVEIRTSDQDSEDPSHEQADRDPGQPLRLTDTITTEGIGSSEHPLDPLMELAEHSLEIIDSKYACYSAKMLSQVRTNDTLHEENLMLVKVRHDCEVETDGKKTEIPFSIYTQFLKPKSKVGQEAIWVRGKEDEQILGHGTGLLNFKIVRLPPTGVFAMSGNRYPIYQIGFRNLIIKMKEFGENDRKYGECNVTIKRNVEVDGRSCTLLTVTHPEKRDHFDYHIAKIYIDDEFEIPTGYEGYLWPETKGADPPLLEKYFYLDLHINCGLKDIDFDVTNPEYAFPAW